MSSRLEGREKSESRRHRSRFDQEPGPKRSRRDGKPEAERPSSKSNSDHQDRSDGDQKHSRRSRRDGKPEAERPSSKSNLDHQDRSGGDQKHSQRLQDAVPLEAPAVQVSDSVARSKDSEKSNIDGRGIKHSDPIGTSSPKRSSKDGKPGTERPSEKSDSGHQDRSDVGQMHRQRLQDAAPLKAPAVQASDSVAHTKDSGKSNVDGRGTKHSDLTGVSRSRYSQHDNRGNAWQAGRGFSRNGTSDRGWRRDSRERQSDWRNSGHGVGSNIWRHDRFSETVRGTRSFSWKRSENKDSDESGKANKVGVEDPLKQNSKEQNDRQNESGSLSSKAGEVLRDRPYRLFGKGKIQRGPPWLPSRDNYDNEQKGGLKTEGPKPPLRDRFRPPQPGEHDGRWKHDLYDEANKSPGPRNEEDMVARVEALLAS